MFLLTPLSFRGKMLLRGDTKMKKFRLFASVFQIIVGVLAIVAFAFIAISGEPIGRWWITLALAVLFVVLGVYDIATYKGTKNDFSSNGDEKSTLDKK